MGEKFEGKGEEPRRSKTFINFKGVVTRASRNAIPEDAWYNLENIIPLGPANAHSVNNISTVRYNFNLDIIYWMQYVNVLNTDYLIAFETNGDVYAYNIATSVVTKIGNAVLSGTGSRCCQWNNSQILFIDSTGYYNWPGSGSLVLITGFCSSDIRHRHCGSVWPSVDRASPRSILVGRRSCSRMECDILDGREWRRILGAH